MKARWLVLPVLLGGLGVPGLYLPPAASRDTRPAAATALAAGSDAPAPWTVQGAMNALALVHPPRLEPAPDFTVALQDGKDFRLSEERGRVVFINFWATWCPPCREEMPTLERLWRQHQAEPFVLLAVALDANPALVAPFITREGFTFPVAVEPKLHVASLYGVRSLPTSVIVDRQGRLAALAFGPRAWDGPAANALMKGLEH